MVKKKLNIALIAPSRNVYSETFIQAHKQNLNGNIFQYYHNGQGLELEGKIPFNKVSSWKYKVQRMWKSNSYSWYFDRLILHSFKKCKIDVILIEYGDLAASHLKMLKEAQIPFIVHFHGYDASVKDIIKHFNYYQELFTSSDGIVAVSRKMEKDFLKWGCPRDKLTYNVYGPREDFLNITPGFNKQQFIAIGRFVDKKAPYYLILTFVEVVKIFPEAKLIIGGDGPLLNTCKNLVRNLTLEANIEMPGIITATDYKNYLSQSIAMVQHSLTAENGDSEGTPLSILEASAAGLPVIATFHGGIPDVVEHGQTGFLVEEHDTKTMATYFIKLLQNIDLARSMGERGKERIRKNFTMKRHISGLDNMLLQLYKNH